MAPHHFIGPRLVVFLYLSISLLFNNRLIAQPGNLDASFGNNGKLIFNGAQKILPSATGDFFVISTYGIVNNNRVAIITKYFNNGLIDASYGLNGVSNPINISFADAVLQQDGKIVIAGNTEGINYTDIHYDLRVARVNNDGSLDNSFGVGGYASWTASFFSYEIIKSVSLLQDKIIVKGFTTSVIGQFTAFLIWVIDANGITKSVNDPYFQFLHYATFNPFFNFGETVSGVGDKIIMTGYIDDPGTGYDFSVAMYKADGAPDYAFNGNGKLTTDFGSEDIAKAAGIKDNKLIVAGSTYNLNLVQNDFAMARYNNDGSMDNSFNGNGKLTIGLGGNAEVRSVVVNNGKIIAGGFAGNAVALVQINDDGSLDENFGKYGKQITAITEGIFDFDKLYVSGNRLYVTGLLGSQPGSSLGMVLAYQLDCPVSLACPSNKVVFTDPGKCNAVVNDVDPAVTATCNAAIVNYVLTGAVTGSGIGSVSGKVFNKGITLVTYSLANNPSNSCSFTINVEDHEAPVITKVYASPNVLWPANHKMIDVVISYGLTDNCAATSILSVVSNEPDRGMGKDDVANDWQIIDAHHVRLRSERSGNGNGRIYTVSVLATDDAGNTTTKNVLIKVPHDQEDKEGDELIVNIYPNPATNNFGLSTQTKNTGLVNIRVTDYLGRIIEVRSNISPNSLVQIGNNYPVGIYTIEIMQERESVKKMLIKIPPGSAKF